MTCYILVLIVEDVNFECASGEDRRGSVGGKGFLGWEPEVKLCQPVLKRVHLLWRKQRFRKLIYQNKIVTLCGR